MKDKLQKFRELLTEVVATALSFICLGVLIQLLLPQGETILGWSPIENVKAGGSAFIGVIAIVLLYILFIRKK